MLKYTVRRLLFSMLSLFIILTVVFILLRQMPVEGYFDSYEKLSQQTINTRLKSMGLLDPMLVQLKNFYSGLLFHFDLGTSTRYRVGATITSIVAEKAPLSLQIGLMSMALALLLGVPLGIMMARSKSGFFDKFGTLFIVLVNAVPAAIYYILIQMYATDLFKLPMLFQRENPVTWVLPVFSMSLGNMAYFAMWLRRYMLDELNKDYVRLARAKGVPSSKILSRHVLRNAMVPMIQYLPTLILYTIMGSIYVESLYSIPGMGGLLVNVINRQDNPMVQALVMIFSCIGIVGLLLGDILMAIADPRISFSKKAGAR